jgi:hypothetical protein
VAADPWNIRQAFASLLGLGGAGPSAGGGFAAGSTQFAKLVDSSERFTAAARKYLEESLRAPGPAAAEAARTFGNFLREQSMESCLPPWNSAFGGTIGDPAQATSPFDLPAFGLGREHQQRAQRAAEAARRMADAQRRLQVLWFDVLRDAAAAFVAKLEPASPSAPTPEALRTLYDTWIDCAEEAYARIAHGESFCEAQAEFVNAGSAWRAECQASVEQWAKLLDLPTRSELSALGMRLADLERALRTKSRARPAGGKTPKPPPTRRAPRRRKS